MIIKYVHDARALGILKGVLQQYEEIAKFWRASSCNSASLMLTSFNNIIDTPEKRKTCDAIP